MNNFATANNLTVQRSVERVDTPTPLAGRGVLTQVGARPGQASLALARCGIVWQATIRHRRLGEAGRRRARYGLASQARRDDGWLGSAFRGNAGEDWLGRALHGGARQSNAGTAWRGGAGRSVANHDTNRGARPGYKLRSHFLYLCLP